MASPAAPFNPPPTEAALISAKPEVEDIEWLGRDEAIVTWSFVDGPPITARISVEFDEQFVADGDAPPEVLAKVETDAADFLDYDEDVDLDDGYRYASERHYEGGSW